MILYICIAIVMFVTSWWFILSNDVIEGQNEEGFFFVDLFRDLWRNDEVTEFGKIIFSIILSFAVLYILITSLLILKPLFYKTNRK